MLAGSRMQATDCFTAESMVWCVRKSTACIIDLCIVAVPKLEVVASAGAGCQHSCKQQQHLLYLLQRTQQLELPHSTLLQLICKQHRLCQTAAEQIINIEA